MENNNSALRINQVIAVFTVLIVLGTNIQLFNIRPNNVKLSVQNSIQEEVKLAQTYEREVKVTARTEIDRSLRSEKPAEPEVKYKKIEEIEISRNMDLTVRTGISKEDFNKLLADLKSDTSGFFERNSNTIYELCEKYEINELFFCGLIAAESGWKIASSHRRTNNFVSMMSKGKLISYDTEAEGLEAAAKLLHKHYLSESGAYYYGKTLSDVQVRYCPGSSTWVGLVYGCMKYIIK